MGFQGGWTSGRIGFRWAEVVDDGLDMRMEATENGVGRRMEVMEDMIGRRMEVLEMGLEGG